MPEMTSEQNCWLRTAILFLPPFLFPWRSASAQTFQFLAEVDFYYGIPPNIRFDFQAKETREAPDPKQAEIVPRVDFDLKPILWLKDMTALDLGCRCGGQN